MGMLEKICEICHSGGILIWVEKAGNIKNGMK